jgi:hypothetical protein
MQNQTPPQTPITYESLMAAIYENDRIIREKFAESDRFLTEKLAESDRFLTEKFAETDRMIKELNKEIGGMSKSNGEVAEAYFINSFENHPWFAGQEYDKIASNVRQKMKKLNLEGEYDLVLYNCISVVIIEIKYKARKEDVAELLEKPQSFKQLFPEYAHFDIYLGLAGLHVNETAAKEAQKHGIAVIKQVGDNVVINDTHLKVF